MRARRYIWIVFLVVTAAGLVAAAAPADQSTPGISLSQANEDKARQHYLAGDAAMKTGDTLTAVVEWEAALRLKPSSSYTAKMLSAAAAKLGADGAEAYAHYVGTCDLATAGKLDDAGKELDLALSYRPKGQTPQCLTAKALELAALQKAAGKPVDTTQPKPTTTTAATTDKTTTTTAATTTPTKSTSTASKTTSNKSSSSTKNTKKATKTSKPKAPRPPVYYPPRPPRLKYVHGYTVNGMRVPGHYTYKQPRPRPLPPPR